MNRQENTENVFQFFDTNPINEQEISTVLKQDGVQTEGLTEDVLENCDQDRFGGLDAVDKLSDLARFSDATHVLDVCSGIGGPARYVAHTCGCKVTGIDITQSRHESAIHLRTLAQIASPSAAPIHPAWLRCSSVA